MLGVTKFCGTTLVQKGAVWVREDVGFFSLTTIFTRILVLAFPFIDEDVFISEGQLAVTLWEIQD